MEGDKDYQTKGSLLDSPAKFSDRGIIYLSELPPYCGTKFLRSVYGTFGEISRMHLVRTDPGKVAFEKTRAKTGVHPFKEAWIEYTSKSVAKRVAMSLNNQPVGQQAPKNYKFRNTLWSVKYLSGFKWSQLGETTSHAKEMHQKKVEAHLLQSKKANTEYLKSVGHAKRITKINELRKTPEPKFLKSFTQKEVQNHNQDKLQPNQLSIFKKVLPVEKEVDDFFCH